MIQIFFGHRIVRHLSKLTTIFIIIGYCAASNSKPIAFDAETQTLDEDWDGGLNDRTLYECESLNFFESQPKGWMEREWVDRQISVIDKVTSWVESIGNSVDGTGSVGPSFSTPEDAAYGLKLIKSMTLDFETFLYFRGFTEGSESALTIAGNWKVSKREWTRHRFEIGNGNFRLLYVRSREPALIVMPRRVMLTVLKHRQLCLEKRFLELILPEEDSAWNSVGNVWNLILLQFQQNFIQVPDELIVKAKMHYQRFARQIDELINQLEKSDLFSSDDYVNQIEEENVANLIKSGFNSYDDFQPSPFYSMVAYLASTTSAEVTEEQLTKLSSGEASLDHSGLRGRSFLDIWIKLALVRPDTGYLLLSSSRNFSDFWDSSMLDYVMDQLPNGADDISTETNYFDGDLRVKDLIGILQKFQRLITHCGDGISSGMLHDVLRAPPGYRYADDSKSNVNFLNQVRQYVKKN